MRKVDGLEELESLVGSDLDASPWQTITQAQIDGFAEITGDRQWIHVDQKKAAGGPYGKTIAHGYLVLSLVPTMFEQSLNMVGFSMGVNYGSDKIRYLAPVPVDSRVRGVIRLKSVDRATQSAKAYFTVTIELEGATKPACVAEVITLLMP